MPFRDDIDFCCLVLEGPVLGIQGTQVLAPDLSVSDSTDHIDLDFWEEWLGTIQTQTLRRSSFVITAERHSPVDAGANYRAREAIERRVRLAHWALVLGGNGFNSASFMVGGNTAGGRLHLGPISFGLTPCHPRQYRRHRRISLEDLQRAAMMLPSMERVYDHVPDPDYRRIRKGFNSWIQGVQNDDPIQALHSFVRAAEAIIRPTTTTRTERKITSTFLRRGQTFIGHSRRNERLLRQLYNLRSCIEHVKNVLPVVQKLRRRSSEESFAFRALQAELLASTIYSRIFTNDDLRERLRTEPGVEGFWRRNDSNRQKLWGDEFNLTLSAHQWFSPQSPNDLL